MEQITISLETQVREALETYLSKAGMSWNTLLKKTVEHCQIEEETLLAIQEAEETVDQLEGYRDLDSLFRDLKA